MNPDFEKQNYVYTEVENGYESKRNNKIKHRNGLEDIDFDDYGKYLEDNTNVSDLHEPELYKYKMTTLVFSVVSIQLIFVMYYVFLYKP